MRDASCFGMCWSGKYHPQSGEKLRRREVQWGSKEVNIKDPLVPNTIKNQTENKNKKNLIPFNAPDKKVHPTAQPGN